MAALQARTGRAGGSWTAAGPGAAGPCLLARAPGGICSARAPARFRVFGPARPGPACAKGRGRLAAVKNPSGACTSAVLVRAGRRQLVLT